MRKKLKMMYAERFGWTLQIPGVLYTESDWTQFVLGLREAKLSLWMGWDFRTPYGVGFAIGRAIRDGKTPSIRIAGGAPVLKPLGFNLLRNTLTGACVDWT